MSLLKEAERLEEKVRKLIEGLFGKEAAREPLEIRRAILGEIEEKVEPVGRDRRAFPFSHLRVRLFASDAQRRAIFKAVFVEDRRLENHIIELLRRNRAQLPPNLQISVNLEKRVARAVESEARDFCIDYHCEAPNAQPKARGDAGSPSGAANHAARTHDEEELPIYEIKNQSRSSG
jgi:hypothetical protein